MTREFIPLLNPIGVEIGEPSLPEPIHNYILKTKCEPFQGRDFRRIFSTGEKSKMRWNYGAKN